MLDGQRYKSVLSNGHSQHDQSETARWSSIIVPFAFRSETIMEEEDELEAQDEELVDDYDIFDMDYVPPPPKERNKWFRLLISFLISLHILLYLNISFSLFLPPHSVIFFLSILYKYCLLNIFHAISITVSLYIYNSFIAILIHLFRESIITIIISIFV